MSIANHELGKRGEDIACTRLEELGMRITARNLHIGHDEIDIIAADGDTIVFVEVKTRTEPSSYGRPSRAVDFKKRGRLIRAAQEYLRQLPAKKPLRIDVIEVVFPQLHYNTPIDISRLIPLRVNHIKSAVKNKQY